MSISKSMVEFQSKLKPINKDAENPFFKSSYLSLSGILEATLPILSECGLAITQPMRIDGELAILQTKITHENGEFILSEMVLPYVADPQKFGSLITYYKRYQLQAMLGICGKEDDDDGNNASYDPNKKPQNSYNKPAPQAPKAQPSQAQINHSPKNDPIEQVKGFLSEKAEVQDGFINEIK